MADEARFKVRIDSRQAQGELRALVKQAAQTSGKVASGVRSAVGRGLGVVGLGAGVGTGLAAIRGATESGFGDTVNEALGGIGAQVAEFFLGDLDDKARASKSAREETIQAFGAIAGARKGGIPPGAENYFNQIRGLREQEEKGRQLFERDERFRGPGMTDIVDRVMQGFGILLSKAVSDLAMQLNPFK